MRHIVIDTNVFFSALRSLSGASHFLMDILDKGWYVTHISVPLILEYEAVAKEHQNETNLTLQEIEDILDYICKVATHQKIHFRYRPFANDPNDDMVAELAINAGCDTIVTFNTRNFLQAKAVGIRVLTPKEFLKEIGALQ